MYHLTTHRKTHDMWSKPITPCQACSLSLSKIPPSKRRITIFRHPKHHTSCAAADNTRRFLFPAWRGFPRARGKAYASNNIEHRTGRSANVVSRRIACLACMPIFDRPPGGDVSVKSLGLGRSIVTEYWVFLLWRLNSHTCIVVFHYTHRRGPHRSSGNKETVKHCTDG